jgi:hypothetical protein
MINISPLWASWPHADVGSVARQASTATIKMANWFNEILANDGVVFLAMFKKLLLATLIVIIGLWGAGVDVASIKDNLLINADRQAGKFSGQSKFSNDNWSDEAKPS